MEGKQINITSTTVEKGLDAAKGFLGKLISPAAEEVGLLLKDQITAWRFRNQIRVLNRAKEYCEKNEISPKTISPKLLCPLIENAGLEDDEFLQDKWAVLLANLVDSEQNIQNHVFPYILSQLSLKEFNVLETIYEEMKTRKINLNNELSKIQKRNRDILSAIQKKIDDLKEGDLEPGADETLQEALANLENVYRKHEKLGIEEEGNLCQELEKSASIPQGVLAEFEMSNVIRLGIVKEWRDFRSPHQEVMLRDRYPRPTRFSGMFGGSYRTPVRISVRSITKNRITELGIMFFSACQEKMKQ